jgi:hypothetical protein
MHEKALPPGSRKLLDSLKRLSRPALRGWTLAGGTGLALRVGHRLSDDFDFFRTDDMDRRGLQDALSVLGEIETLQQGEKTLGVLLSGVKLSFFQIGDSFLFPVTQYSFFRIADTRDIALMKLTAIANGGSRKDIIDLFRILQTGPALQEYLDLLPRKYGTGRTNAYQVLMSLTYFDDAEEEPMPKMIGPFDWEECKAFFVREAGMIVLPH